MGERAVREALGGAGLRIDSVRAADPDAGEHASCAILRELEPPRPVPPFPGPATQHTPAARAVAIGARGLRKTFGAFDRGQGHRPRDAPTARSTVCSAPTARGRRPRSRCCAGWSSRSEGDVQLAGETGALRSPAVRQQVGYMSQKFSLYDDLTIDENLDFFAGVYRVPPERRAERKRWVLEFAGLEGQGRAAHREPAGRLEAAGGVRGGDHARAARALPRRADVRRRSHRAPRLLGHDQPARRPRHRDPGHHALSGRGRAVQSPRASWWPASWWPRARRAA